jgi:hypothetical protein
VLSSVDLFCVLCEEVCSLRKAPKNHDKIASGTQFCYRILRNTW